MRMIMVVIAGMLVGCATTPEPYQTTKNPKEKFKEQLIMGKNGKVNEWASDQLYAFPPGEDRAYPAPHDYLVLNIGEDAGTKGGRPCRYVSVYHAVKDITVKRGKACIHKSGEWYFEESTL